MQDFIQWYFIETLSKFRYFVHENPLYNHIHVAILVDKSKRYIPTPTYLSTVKNFHMLLKCHRKVLILVLKNSATF